MCCWWVWFGFMFVMCVVSCNLLVRIGLIIFCKVCVLC